jgi:hypothetical protein
VDASSAFLTHFLQMNLLLASPGRVPIKGCGFHNLPIAPVNNSRKVFQPLLAPQGFQQGWQRMFCLMPHHVIDKLKPVPVWPYP